MPSALDTFRAQQEAADAVYARLQDVAILLADLRKQADALQRTDELKRLVELEERWLAEARQTVIQVQRLREKDAERFWRGVVLRWTIAAVFAIGAAAAAGAAYATVERPAERELDSLKVRLEFSEYIERRVARMSPSQRHTFDRLMGFADGRADGPR